MADTKGSALPSASAASTDELYLIDDPGGTPSSKRATVSSLSSALGVVVGTDVQAYDDGLDASASPATVTPVGTDEVLIRDDPAGTPAIERVTVDALLGVTKTSFKNALDADTGITGDGTTDDSAAIGTLLSAGGDFFFPAATYKLESTVSITHTDHLRVVCSPGAIFLTSTDAEITTGDLFDFDTNVTNDDLVAVEWYGGIVNACGVPNASGTGLNQSSRGLLNQGAQATTDCFSFRDGYWSRIHVEGVSFFNKTDAHKADPTNALRQHWMGDYVNGYVSGSDSYIFANSGPGTITIRDCVFAGSRDSAVYVGGAGNAEATPPSLVNISGCKMYWCSEGVSVKDEVTGPTVVSDCLAWGCFMGFVADHRSSEPGADHVQFVNCQTRYAGWGFRVVESDSVQLSNCRNFQLGHQDWNADPLTSPASGALGTTGSVQLTGGASGSVDSITITNINGGANILTGAVAFDTDLDTTAAAVAADINSGYGTHGLRASSVTDTVYIHTGDTSGGEKEGETVTSTATTITTTDTDMAWMFPDAYGFEVEGCVGTRIDDPTVAGSSYLFTGNPTTINGFKIHSLSAVATADTRITNAFIEGISATGGDVSSAGSDPVRTYFHGLHFGATAATTEAPTLLDSSCFADYQEQFRSVLASQEDRTSTTTMAATALSLTLRADAIYEIDGLLYMDGSATGDAKFSWTDPDSGTADGYFSILGPTAGNGTSGAARFDATAWSGNQTSFGLAGTGTPTIFRVVGTYQGDTDGDLVLKFAQQTSDATASSILAGSWIRATRIG